MPCLLVGRKKKKKKVLAVGKEKGGGEGKICTEFHRIAGATLPTRKHVALLVLDGGAVLRSGPEGESQPGDDAPLSVPQRPQEESPADAVGAGVSGHQPVLLAQLGGPDAGEVTRDAKQVARYAGARTAQHVGGEHGEQVLRDHRAEHRVVSLERGVYVDLGLEVADDIFARVTKSPEALAHRMRRLDEVPRDGALEGGAPRDDVFRLSERGKVCLELPTGEAVRQVCRDGRDEPPPVGSVGEEGDLFRCVWAKLPSCMDGWMDG
jgi:hypothetical protein